ncbi:MAG: serine/threonine protein kinase [Variibacter sp.]|nr:serine/threonine protein kinase [Variibacter sp.]
MADTPARAGSGGEAPDLPELSARWRAAAVLKRDVFSTVERGAFHDQGGEAEAVLRRIDQVPWWSFLVARHFLQREARALAAIGMLGIAPRLLYQGPRALIRSWIGGVALHIAKPHGDAEFFRSAKTVLHRLHRAGVCHNDLAKEQNWLRGRDGRAYLTDFQLSLRFARRGRLFRLAAYEDLRHLLKHKRRYAPAALTASERRVLARKSWIARAWLATGKRVYLWVTRGVLGFTDREGAGNRLVADAPRIAAALRGHPQVEDVAIVPFPERRTGSGLYAFVQSQAVSEAELLSHLARAGLGVDPPEHIQVAAALPRNAAGETRSEWLTLIAMNQLDLVESLAASATERDLLARLVAGRKNLLDRFNTGRS